MKYIIPFLLCILTTTLQAVDSTPLPLFSDTNLIYIRIDIEAYYDTDGAFHPSNTEWIASSSDIDVTSGQVMDDGCVVGAIYYNNGHQWWSMIRFHGNGYAKDKVRNQWWIGHHHEFHKQPTYRDTPLLKEVHHSNNPEKF